MIKRNCPPTVLKLFIDVLKFETKEFQSNALQIKVNNIEYIWLNIKMQALEIQNLLLFNLY